MIALELCTRSGHPQYNQRAATRFLNKSKVGFRAKEKWENSWLLRFISIKTSRKEPTYTTKDNYHKESKASKKKKKLQK